MRAMHREPRALQRPVVVVGGWMDPGIIAPYVRRRIKRLTGDGRIVSVSFAFCGSFDACRQRLVDRVNDAYPSDDPATTVSMDVVAFSMGGLVARYAAMAPQEAGVADRRLRIERLFTISTPHRGARLATLATWDRLQIDMRKGSAFLEALDAALAEADYEVFAYARLDDMPVGESNAAPAGRAPWWVPNPPFGLGHAGAAHDIRILADVARRLRGETPYTMSPPAPLPGADKESRGARSLPPNLSSVDFRRPPPKAGEGLSRLPARLHLTPDVVIPSFPTGTGNCSFTRPASPPRRAATVPAVRSGRTGRRGPPRGVRRRPTGRC